MAQVKDTFGDEMLRQKDNPNRMEEMLESEKKPTFKDKAKALKDKLVATPEDMQKMTENRADVKNATERSIGANPVVSKKDLLQDNATGQNEPINHVSLEQARGNESLPEPVKTDSGSVLADLVDSGAVDDTYKSGFMGGTKDGVPLTTEQKREAEGLGPENFGIGEKANGIDVDNAGNSNSNVESNGLSSQEQLAKDSAMNQWKIAQEVLDEQNPYKSGADYLQALWGKGAKGKAQAVANVLGNLLGATGKGATGQDYTSDWQRYKDEYTKQSQERRAEAAKNAQDMVNTVALNKEARAELVNALSQAKANGANISEKDMAAINAWQNATTPSSALNKAIASLVTSVQNQGLLGTAGSIISGLGGK